MYNIFIPGWLSEKRTTYIVYKVFQCNNVDRGAGILHINSKVIFSWSLQLRMLPDSNCTQSGLAFSVWAFGFV